MAITYAGNTWPPEGTLWEVLRFGSASGAFNRLEGLDLGGGRVLQPAFSATNLVLVLSNQQPQKFLLSTVQPQPGQLELRFTGDFDTLYSLEASSNLTSWTSILQTNRPDGVIYFREGTTFPWRFYRMRALP